MLRTARTLVLIASLVVATGIPAPRSSAEEAAAADAEEPRPAPLVLDGSVVLDLPGQPGFDLTQGTIEFWVAALWDEDPGHFPCVLASRDDTKGDDAESLARGTRYSVHITGARDEIGLWNGRKWGSVPFDFSDEKYHHAMLVTEGERTEVFVDGVSRGVMELGYGSGTGLPLHIGTSDGRSEPFLGALWAVRIWDIPLDAKAREELARVYGPPEETHPAAEHLVAFSLFTTKSKDFFTRPATEP